MSAPLRMGGVGPTQSDLFQQSRWRSQIGDLRQNQGFAELPRSRCCGIPEPSHETRLRSGRLASLEQSDHRERRHIPFPELRFQITESPALFTDHWTARSVQGLFSLTIERECKACPCYVCGVCRAKVAYGECFEFRGRCKRTILFPGWIEIGAVVNPGASGTKVRQKWRKILDDVIPGRLCHLVKRGACARVHIRS